MYRNDKIFTLIYCIFLYLLTLCFTLKKRLKNGTYYSDWQIAQTTQKVMQRVYCMRNV